jgi:hypothetical protein
MKLADISGNKRESFKDNINELETHSNNKNIGG